MALGTILLPYDGSEAADALLRLACQVVGTRGRLIALYSTRISASVPLEPLPAWIDKEGNDALDHAEMVAAAQGIAIETVLTRVRRPIDAIVAEARACEATAIFLPQPSWRRPWKRLHVIFTAHSLLRQTSCQVLVGAWLGATYDRRTWHDVADGAWRTSASPFDRAERTPTGSVSSGSRGYALQPLRFHGTSETPGY